MLYCLYYNSFLQKIYNRQVCVWLKRYFYFTYKNLRYIQIRCTRYADESRVSFINVYFFIGWTYLIKQGGLNHENLQISQRPQKVRLSYSLLITLLIFTQRDFNDNITALRFRSIIWLLHGRTISRRNTFSSK